MSRQGDSFVIKVCGMRQPDNIAAVEQLGVQWMGFIFYEKSPRYVAQPPALLPTRCQRAGVFVNPAEEQVARLSDSFGLHIVQLHGSESPQFCRRIRERLPQLKIVKAVSVEEGTPLPPTAQYQEVCDYLLFDTRCTGVGGSGRTFDWQQLGDYHGSLPFLLSGGIGPHSLESLARFDHPQWCGIDLNSRFETAPALKDCKLLAEFLRGFRELTHKQ